MLLTFTFIFGQPGLPRSDPTSARVLARFIDPPRSDDPQFDETPPKTDVSTMLGAHVSPETLADKDVTPSVRGNAPYANVSKVSNVSKVNDNQRSCGDVDGFITDLYKHQPSSFRIFQLFTIGKQQFAVTLLKDILTLTM